MLPCLVLSAAVADPYKQSLMKLSNASVCFLAVKMHIKIFIKKAVYSMYW